MFFRRQPIKLVFISVLIIIYSDKHYWSKPDLLSNAAFSFRETKKLLQNFITSPLLSKILIDSFRLTWLWDVQKNLLEYKFTFN